MNINGVRLRDGERGHYGKAAGRAAAKYLRENGSASYPVPASARVLVGGVWDWASESARESHTSAARAHAARWELEHGAAYREVQRRAGESAVKRMLTKHGDADRLAELGLSRAAGKARSAATPVSVESVESAASGEPVDLSAVPVERLQRMARPYWRRQLSAEERAAWPLGEVRAELARRESAPVDGSPVNGSLASPVEGSPEPVGDTVPAPMPRQTRAARKASNRELAARMRAAGIPVTAETWRAAKAGELEGIGA